MARWLLRRLLPACMPSLLVGCISMWTPKAEDLARDGGHLELLVGFWSADQGREGHSFELKADSTFEECLGRYWLSDSTLSTGTCVQGSFFREDADFRFRPGTCHRYGTGADCDSLDIALGDTSADPEEFLVTLRYRHHGFRVDVIIDQECDEWETGFIGQECVSLGEANGILELSLVAQGAPLRKSELLLRRTVDPDSL